MVARSILEDRRYILVFAAVLSLMLVIPIVTIAAPPQTFTTRLILDAPLQEVNNGDAVIFTGRLLRALDGVGVPSTSVTVYEKGSRENTVLGSGMTDSEGYFRIAWVAEPVNPLSDTVNVFAAFDGNVEYGPSLTLEYNIDIVTRYSIEVNADRHFYHVGDRAVFTVRVLGPSNNPVEPKDIHAFFGGLMAQLNRIDSGLYRYTTGELTHGIHSLSVTSKISTTNSQFRADFNSVSSTAQIHVTKRPTTMTGDVAKETYFIGDEITVEATLYDVVRNGYMTDKDLTGYFTLPDETERSFTLAPQGNKYVGTYAVEESDPVGSWTGRVTFNGDYALQPSEALLASFDVNDYRISTSVTQQGNSTIIDLSNHEDHELDIYEIVIGWNDADMVSVFAPSSWSFVFENSTKTVYFSTEEKPIKPGKALTFQVETSSLLQSFTWKAKDVDGDVVASGSYSVQ